MASKNGETRQCGDTNRASVSVISGKTNMNIVTFNSIEVKTQNFMGDISLTLDDLARCLYQIKGDDRSVTPFVNAKRALQRIYQKHADEFSECMTGVVKLTTPGGVQESRVFSLRGAHLIAMFARTPVAKEFRSWILDILDREVSLGNASPAFNFEMYARNAKAACSHMAIIRDAWINELHPALKAVGAPLAERLHDRILDAGTIMQVVSDGLERVSLSKHSWDDDFLTAARRFAEVARKRGYMLVKIEDFSRITSMS